jgi:hypothetical protein
MANSRGRSDSFARPQVAHEGGDIRVRHRCVMATRQPVALWQQLVKVPAPSRRVFAKTKTLGFRGVQHPLDR